MATKKVQRNSKSSVVVNPKGYLQHIGQYFNRHPKLSSLVAVLVLVTLFDVVTPLGGQLRFYAKWVECGRRPYATAGLVWNTTGISHYELSPVFMVDRGGNNPYFCTPKEAEVAGYSASEYQYSFPNLTPEEEKSMWDRAGSNR